MVRTIMATPGWDRLGTLLSRLALKWVQHRCQAAPANIVAMACFTPWWASEMTNSTSANLGQNFVGVDISTPHSVSQSARRYRSDVNASNSRTGGSARSADTATK